jgi:putative tryptophan/tyrosine transport system substrate-binding protein
MRRRGFISVPGGCIAWPLAEQAQQEAMRLLDFSTLGVQESGYVEGQNVTIEYRWARRPIVI